MPWFTDVTNNTPNKFWIEEPDLVWARVHPAYREIKEEPPVEEQPKKVYKKVKHSDSNTTG